MRATNETKEAMKLRTVEEMIFSLSVVIPSDIKAEDVIFFCIGTDRSTGDALGPLVGTYLEGLGYTNVIGTIDAPAHAMNYEERYAAIPEGKTVIAIDACLGQVSSIGLTTISKGSLKPGAGVDKDLPAVGDYAIKGMVNVGGFMEYYVLQSTRLSLVMKMAKNITSALIERFPIESKSVVHLNSVKSSQLVKK